jgi:porin
MIRFISTFRTALVAIVASAGMALAQDVPTERDGQPPEEEPAGEASVKTCTPPAEEPGSASAAPSVFGGPLCTRAKLTGDWLGLRDELAKKGITFDVSATQYYQGITSGGVLDAFRYAGRADYLLNVDGQKAGLWQGFFINLHGETVYGNSVNSFTGALMPVNTGRLVPIPSGNVTALTGVKFTQALSENFAVFTGKINTLDGFTQPFMPTQGIDAGFMNFAGIANPIIVRTIPYSALGGGFAVLSGGQPIASAMVLDTNNTPTTSGFQSFFDRGVFIMASATLPTNFFGLAGHQTVLGTYSNRTFLSTDSEPYTLLSNLVQGLPATNRITGSWSLLYMFDQALWTDPCDAKRRWGVFGSAGISDGNPNPIRWSGTVGLSGSSPIASRPLDTFGVVYYYLSMSSGFKNIAPRLLPLRNEQGVELFYNIGVTPWCHITPDVQFLIPTRERVDTAIAVGIRAKIDF